MMCPRCSVAPISSLSGACELCGYVPGDGGTAVAQADATDEAARRELAHLFVIDAVLGQGQVSVVYLAHQTGGNTRHVVLKVLPRRRGDAIADEHFRQAMARVASFDHPHITQVLRWGTSDSLVWYAREHMMARTLREVLRASGRIEPRTCQRIAAQAASALDHLHRRGFVHGAIKPENVLLDDAGWVRLCDPLIAPERQPSLLTPADDQRALGALVYECLAGAAPGDAAEIIALPIPNAQPHMMATLARALSPEPRLRFPGVMDFAASLETGVQPLLDTRPSGRASTLRVAMIPDWKPPPRETRRLMPAVIAAGLVVLLAASGLVVSKLAFRDDGWEYASTRAAPARATAPRPAPAPPAAESAATPAPIIMPVRPQQRRRAQPAPVARSDVPPPRAAVPPTTAPPAAAASRAVGTGTLFVNSTPWGQLYIDGQLIGNTPRANVPLAAGSHAIRVVREGFEPFERTISIAPGETVRLTSITLAERGP